MESGDLLDLRGARKPMKLRDKRKEKPDEKWLKEARRIASIKDADILRKLKMKKR